MLIAHMCIRVPTFFPCSILLVFLKCDGKSLFHEKMGNPSFGFCIPWRVCVYEKQQAHQRRFNSINAFETISMQKVVGF